MSDGILVIVSAPSGAGKTSLIEALIAKEPGLRLAVSYTTRAPRPQEKPGVHYHFVDRERFATMLAAGEFLESAEVFGNRYGTAEATVRDELRSGRDLLLEIDWQGARQVRERFPEAVSLFVLPPSAGTLAERLRCRGQDSEAVINGRMARARDEMSHYAEYDYLVVNDVFEEAVENLSAVIRAERLRLARCSERLRPVLAALLDV